MQVPWIIVLTKCDLLSVVEVAQSIAAVDSDLILKFPYLATEINFEKGETKDGIKMDIKALETNFGVSKRIIPVSSATGAGVQRLWTDLLYCAKSTTLYPDEVVNSNAVREHRNADAVRRNDLIKQLQNIKKARMKAASATTVKN